MQAEILFAQKEEREQTSLSHKSDITFVKKLFENLNLNNDAMVRIWRIIKTKSQIKMKTNAHTSQIQELDREFQPEG
jgi:hypothetical protein